MKRLKPWYLAEPELFKDNCFAISSAYPNLCITFEGHEVIWRGQFPIYDDQSVMIDAFEIEMRVPPDYPNQLPSISETAERIPRTLDRHIISSTGCACLFAPEERFLHVKSKSLLEFLDGPVRSFFYGQLFIELKQPWPFGERKHGYAGIAESYLDLFETDRLEIVIRWLELLGRNTVRKSEPCPCGSNIALGDCHANRFYYLRSVIPKDVARKRRMQLLSDVTLVNIFDKKESA